MKKGSPVWLADTRIAAVAPNSIDKANVVLDKGEMSFPIFDYTPDLDVVIQQSNDPVELLKKLQSMIGADSLPEYLIRYIQTTMQSPETIAFHQSSTVENMKDADKEKIERTKGLLGQVNQAFYGTHSADRCVCL
jgi:hypothetical protein